jgi:hypothetical protein
MTLPAAERQDLLIAAQRRRVGGIPHEVMRRYRGERSSLLERSYCGAGARAARSDARPAAADRWSNCEKIY